MLILMFAVPEFSWCYTPKKGIFCEFQFCANLFYKYENGFLREKSKWNSKLENGYGLKNAAMHLWFK